MKAELRSTQIKKPCTPTRVARYDHQQIGHIVIKKRPKRPKSPTDSDEKIRKSFAKDMKQIRPTSKILFEKVKEHIFFGSDQKLSSHLQRPSDPKINETLIMAIQSATINWSSNKQFTKFTQFWSLVIL